MGPRAETLGLGLGEEEADDDGWQSGLFVLSVGKVRGPPSSSALETEDEVSDTDDKDDGGEHDGDGSYDDPLALPLYDDGSSSGEAPRLRETEMGEAPCLENIGGLRCAVESTLGGLVDAWNSSPASPLVEGAVAQGVVATYAGVGVAADSDSGESTGSEPVLSW